VCVCVCVCMCVYVCVCVCSCVCVCVVAAQFFSSSRRPDSLCTAVTMRTAAGLTNPPTRRSVRSAGLSDGLSDGARENPDTNMLFCSDGTNAATLTSPTAAQLGCIHLSCNLFTGLRLKPTAIRLVCGPKCNVGLYTVYILNYLKYFCVYYSECM